MRLPCTDKELSEHLKLSRRTLQEYRKQGILPYIILPQFGIRIVHKKLVVS